jgi:hypothetical protein
MKKPQRLRDGSGMTVEPAVIDGVAQFIVRGPSGHLTYGLGMDPGPITTPEGLAAVGVDLATLAPIPSARPSRKARP